MGYEAAAGGRLSDKYRDPDDQNRDAIPSEFELLSMDATTKSKERLFNDLHPYLSEVIVEVFDYINCTIECLKGSELDIVQCFWRLELKKFVHKVSHIRLFVVDIGVSEFEAFKADCKIENSFNYFSMELMEYFADFSLYDNRDPQWREGRETQTLSTAELHAQDASLIECERPFFPQTRPPVRINGLPDLGEKPNAEHDPSPKSPHRNSPPWRLSTLSSIFSLSSHWSSYQKDEFDSDSITELIDVKTQLTERTAKTAIDIDRIIEFARQSDFEFVQRVWRAHGNVWIYDHNNIGGQVESSRQFGNTPLLNTFDSSLVMLSFHLVPLTTDLACSGNLFKTWFSELRSQFNVAWVLVANAINVFEPGFQRLIEKYDQPINQGQDPMTFEGHFATLSIKETSASAKERVLDDLQSNLLPALQRALKLDPHLPHIPHANFPGDYLVDQAYELIDYKHVMNPQYSYKISTHLVQIAYHLKISFDPLLSLVRGHLIPTIPNSDSSLPTQKYYTEWFTTWNRQRIIVNSSFLELAKSFTEDTL
ncbi:hypothetical protein PSTT_07220 [Puccinia striiformis]|uniref:Uncharacterized protein n=1 Tax=Puccinia striiformis TaxID=27350 RepID=A0A2S4VHE0_9BASI|nr:hypothetical protein PSTT_07220 [Puccinia striiformis]